MTGTYNPMVFELSQTDCLQATMLRKPSWATAHLSAELVSWHAKDMLFYQPLQCEGCCSGHDSESLNYIGVKVLGASVEAGIEEQRAVGKTWLFAEVLRIDGKEGEVAQAPQPSHACNTRLPI